MMQLLIIYVALLVLVRICDVEGRAYTSSLRGYEKSRLDDPLNHGMNEEPRSLMTIQQMPLESDHQQRYLAPQDFMTLSLWDYMESVNAHIESNQNNDEDDDDDDSDMKYSRFMHA